jgi:predicted RNase H-like nuclease (RuvC/YqgF family)
MKNEAKIIELLAESLKGQDRMVAEMKGTNQRLDQTVERLDQTVERLDQTVERLDQTVDRLDHLEIKVEKIENHLVKLNLQTAENTRAIYKLAEKVEDVADLHKRVTKLEKTVYK